MHGWLETPPNEPQTNPDPGMARKAPPGTGIKVAPRSLARTMRRAAGLAGVLALVAAPGMGTAAPGEITTKQAFEFMSTSPQFPSEVVNWIAATCGGAEGAVGPDECVRSLPWMISRAQLIPGRSRELIASFSTGGSSVGSSGVYVIGRQPNGSLRVLMHYGQQVVGYKALSGSRFRVDFNDVACAGPKSGSGTPYAMFRARGGRFAKIADTTNGCAPLSGLRPAKNGGYRGPVE